MSESLTKTNVSGQAQTMSSGRIPPCEGDHSFAPFTPSPVGWCPSAEKAIFLYLESVPLIHKVPPQKHPERCLATLTCSSSWSNVNTCPPVTSCPLKRKQDECAYSSLTCQVLLMRPSGMASSLTWASLRQYLWPADFFPVALRVESHSRTKLKNTDHVWSHP